jgi:maleamate amidohydrolase
LQGGNREQFVQLWKGLYSQFPFGYSSRLYAGGGTMTPPNAVPSDAEFFQQRGFGQKLGFGQRPALLVVDMAKAFTNPEMPLGSNLDKQIEAVQQLLRAAHDREAPVIFSTVSYEDENLRDAGIFGMKQKGSSSLRAGTEGVQIDSRLDFRKTDSLLVKKYASCFFGTDLVSRLLERQVDTLIITGCTTSGCVRASAVDACQIGFRPMVVREAVGDRSQAAHDQSLFDLNAKYADVVSLAETLQYLNALRAAAAPGRAGD